VRCLLLGFACGVGLLQTRASLPSLWMTCLLLLAAMLAALLHNRLAAARPRAATRLVCGALFGFLWAALVAQHYLADELSSELEGQDLVVIGIIDSLPYRFDRGLRFNMALETAAMPDGATVRLPSRLALSWYAEPRGPQPPALQPGERWQFALRLKRPHGNANPDGFDYEAWLLEQNLRATGSVRGDAAPGSVNRRLDAFVPGFTAIVERCR
jgi:competence protein ComEC